MFRGWYRHVCTDVLCTCIHTILHQLKMNQLIIKRIKFCDISHDTQTILSHMSLDVFVCAHRCTKYFNTFVLEHIECEIIVNFLKVGIIVEETIRAIEYVSSRGSLSEDLSLADIKVEISIFFKDGFQYQYERKSFRKWGYVVTTCVFFL